MKKDYVIMGEYFPTKQALRDRIRAIRDAYGDGKSLSDYDTRFMLEVLEGHPQHDSKVGAGVQSIEVRTNPEYTNTRGFWIIRVDGTNTDFSFVECLTPTPHAKKFLRALRAAIEPDIIAFKTAFFDSLDGPFYCPYTGERVHFVGAHVDHKRPKTFQALAADFIALHSIDVTGTEIIGDFLDNNYQDRLADKKTGGTMDNVSQRKRRSPGGKPNCEPESPEKRRPL